VANASTVAVHPLHVEQMAELVFDTPECAAEGLVEQQRNRQHGYPCGGTELIGVQSNQGTDVAAGNRACPEPREMGPPQRPEGLTLMQSDRCGDEHATQNEGNRDRRAGGDENGGQTC
jgi:hypothetical protein